MKREGDEYIECKRNINTEAERNMNIWRKREKGKYR